MGAVPRQAIRRGCAFLISWYIAASSTIAADDNVPLSDTEVSVFLSEVSSAFLHCDAEWFEPHLLSTTTFTHDFADGSSRTMGPEEFMRDLHDTCSAAMPVFFETSRTTMEVGSQTATLHFESKKGTNAPSYFSKWKDIEIGSLEQTTTLIKEGGVIKILKKHSKALPLASGTE